MATSFTLDVSPQMPCHEGRVVSSSSYTSKLQLMRGSYTLPGGSTITNLNLGLAVDTPNVSKVPYLIFNLSSTARLVAYGVTWEPIPGNPGFSYAFVPFLVTDLGGNPTSYTSVQTQFVDLESNGVQLYLLVHPPSDGSTGGNVPMHMLGGMLPASLVNHCPQGGCNSASFTAPSGELTSVSAVIPGGSAAEVTSHKVSYLGVYVDETYLEKAQGQYSLFMVVTVNGKDVFTSTNPMAAIQRNHSLLYMVSGAGATRPLFTLNGGDTLSITSTYPTIPVYLPSPTSATGALVVLTEQTPRTTAPDGTTDPSALDLTYDPVSPFCDFFTGNPLLRSKTPARGCVSDECVTFVNDSVPNVAHFEPPPHLPEGSTPPSLYFFDTPHRQPRLDPITVPPPGHATASFLGSGTGGCPEPPMPPVQNCTKPSDCTDVGFGLNAGCCLTNPTSEGKGICYDPDVYSCSYSPTTNLPTLIPFQHYYRRTPYSTDDGAHPITITFSNDDDDVDYHCQGQDFKDCCEAALRSVRERTCGTIDEPMCPLNTVATQVGACQYVLSDESRDGASTTLSVGSFPRGKGQVNFACTSPQNCTDDSQCESNCVAGRCSCTQSSCPKGSSCIGSVCQADIPGYAYFRGAFARKPPFDAVSLTSSMQTCFANTTVAQINPSAAEDMWDISLTTQANYPVIPAPAQTHSGDIVWRGIHAKDNASAKAHTISKGSYYFSKTAAGNPAHGTSLGPTLTPYYKQCLDETCQDDTMTEFFYGGLCCGVSPRSIVCSNNPPVCVSKGGNTECTNDRESGNFFYLG